MDEAVSALISAMQRDIHWSLYCGQKSLKSILGFIQNKEVLNKESNWPCNMISNPINQFQIESHYAIIGPNLHRYTLFSTICLHLFMHTGSLHHIIPRHNNLSIPQFLHQCHKSTVSELLICIPFVL